MHVLRVIIQLQTGPACWSRRVDTGEIEIAYSSATTWRNHPWPSPRNATLLLGIGECDVVRVSFTHGDNVAICCTHMLCRSTAAISAHRRFLHNMKNFQLSLVGLSVI